VKRQTLKTIERLLHVVLTAAGVSDPETWVVMQAGVLKPAVASLSYLLAAADFSDWPSAARPFGVLLSFATNLRPKVRKRAHDGMVQVLVALQHTQALQPASAAVLQGKLLASITS
jgi:hypothetical protein